MARAGVFQAPQSAFVVLVAVGQMPGQHLVGDDAQCKHIRTRAAGIALQVFRCGVAARAEQVQALDGRRDLLDAGDLGGAEIDDLDGAGRVDHRVFGLQILVDHFQPVEGSEAARELRDDVAHFGKLGLGVIVHPAAQGLAVDVFDDAVQKPPRPLGIDHARHMVAVHPAAHPLLVAEQFEIGRIVGVIHRRCLQHHLLATVLVDGEIDLGALAGMDFAQDAVAIELHSGAKIRRERQFGELAEHLVVGDLGQPVEAHDQAGHIVRAAAGQGLGGDLAGGAIEVVGVLADAGLNQPVGDIFVHAVGGQHEGIAGFEQEIAVVDVEAQVDAQRAGEVVLVVRDPHPVIARQQLQGIAAQPVDAAIADVEQMHGGRFHHQRRERRRQTLVRGVTLLALPVEPAVGGTQHLFHRRLDRPGIRGAVVVGQQALHAGLARHAAVVAAADPVGDDGDDALVVQGGLVGQLDAVAVLILFLRSAIGILADAENLRGGHGSSVRGMMAPRSWLV